MNADAQNGVGTFVIYGLYEGMNIKAFNQYIVDSVDILSFWNHIPLLYMVKTKLNAQDLTERLRPFFDGRLYIVAEVNPLNVSGWLPEPAWVWFRTPAPPYKAPRQTGGIFGLLGIPTKE